MRHHIEGHPSPDLSPATAPSQTVAAYLNSRLAEIGVRHVFAIPGDYIAEYVGTLDDPAQNAGLLRIHPNKEVSAVYSADGYARSCAGRVGCAAFTSSVGALKAVQAVAGAYVERVPLVIINGSPSTAQFNSERDQGVLYHHMLDRSHTDHRIFGEVTAIAVRIDNPSNAPALIDTALRSCITESRPVNIEISIGVSGMQCDAVPNIPLKATPVATPQKSLDQACAAVFAHMQKAKRLV